MADKHTLGPWELDGVEIYPVNGHRASDAICAMSPGQGDETLEANARLIAAAPELLHALDMMILFNKPTKTNAVALNHAYQVIAKARGDQ